jgi:hypothetical protein
MQQHLQYKLTSDPPVQKQKCRVTPIRHPEKDVIPTAEKKEQEHYNIGKHASPPQHVCHDFPPYSWVRH